ncbi:MAG: helix-turn-helix domain-containing protein [Patulibacter minatonensis]
MTDQPLMDVLAVAAKTGFKPETIRRACRRGELVGSKLCGELRFEVADVEAWIERGKYAAKSAPRRDRVDRASATNSLPRSSGGSSVRDRMKRNRQAQ